MGEERPRQAGDRAKINIAAGTQDFEAIGIRLRLGVPQRDLRQVLIPDRVVAPFPKDRFDPPAEIKALLNKAK